MEDNIPSLFTFISIACAIGCTQQKSAKVQIPAEKQGTCDSMESGAISSSG